MKNFISEKYKKIKDNSFSSTEKSEVYDDLINFSIGDPDQTTDCLIIDSAFEDAKSGYTHYTNSSGLLELRKEIQKYQMEEFSLNFDIDEIFVTTSACHAMYLTLQAVLNPGDEVIIPTPHFGLYDFVVEDHGGKCVYLETLEEDGFEINPDKFESLINEKTKAIIINTPNNPTGAVISSDKLKKISEIAQKHDVLIIADDVYTLFSFEKPFTPISKFDPELKNTITLRSFSKDFLMTGWRIGYIIAPKEFTRVVKAINDNLIFSAPSISQRAALHAIRNRQQIQPKIKKEYQERLSLAYVRIQNIEKLDTLPVRGTFYMFVNIKKTNLSSEEFCKQLYENCHILALPGTIFGPTGQGYIRLSLTLSKDKINEAFDRIEKWLE